VRTARERRWLSGILPAVGVLLIGLATQTVVAAASQRAASTSRPFVVSHCDYHTGDGCPKTPPPRSCHLEGKAQDADCTPGALNPAVRQSTIKKTICKTGWTSRIRPPTSYSTPLKLEDMKAYGFGRKSPSQFEFDHLISLELGGAPSDIRNLFPEPYTTAYKKDGLENSLNNDVCDGTITLRKAQREIVNWPAHING
jgi:hypothetical protein